VSSKRRHKPATTAEIAQRVADRRAQEADIAHLRAQPDLRVVVDNGGRLVAANRIDVFALLLSRSALTQAHHDAARRLESDIAAWKGVDRATGSLERVQCAAPQGLVTDRMLDAGARVQAVMGRIGARDVSLLMGLLLPQFAGQTLTRWRETVERITGETRDECQAGAIRGACDNLARGYVAIDYARKTA